MSAAENINYKYVSPKLVMPSLAENETIVTLQSNEETKDEQTTDRDTSRSKSLRRMVAAQAPALTLITKNKGSAAVAAAVKADSTDPQPPSSGPLFDFMTQLMLFQITTAKDSANIGQMNQSMSDAAIVQSQGAMKKALGDMQTFMDDQNKQSWFSSLITLVTLAVTAITVMTGGLGAVVLAGIALGMQTVQLPGQNGQTTNDLLGKFLNTLSTGQAVGVEIGIAIGTMLLMVAGDKAAGSNAVENLGSTGAIVANTSANTAIEMVQMGGNIAGKVLSGAASVGESVGTATLNTVKSVVSSEVELAAKQQATKLLKEMTSKFLMALATGQFSPTVAKAATANIDPSTTLDIGSLKIPVKVLLTVLTQVLTIAASMYASGKLNDTSSDSIMKKLLSSKMSPEDMKLITEGAKTVETSLKLYGAMFSTQIGMLNLDERRVLLEQGEAQLTLTVSQGMTSSLATTFASTEGAVKGVYQNLANISENAARFLDPYNPQNWNR